MLQFKVASIEHTNEWYTSLAETLPATESGFERRHLFIWLLTEENLPSTALLVESPTVDASSFSLRVEVVPIILSSWQMFLSMMLLQLLCTSHTHYFQQRQHLFISFLICFPNFFHVHIKFAGMVSSLDLRRGTACIY